MHISRRALLISFVPAAVRVREAAAADSPTAVIQRLCDALIGLMKEAKGLSFDQRYQRLAPVIEAAYNLPLMSRLSVGAEWARLQPAQQLRVADAFSRYTVAVYANRFDSYNGQRFDVEPTTVTNPSGVIVQTELTRMDGTKLKLNYLMRQNADNGFWQAIDVYMSGTISELATRRADFLAVMQRSGVDGLVQLLQARTSELRQR
jgi:phospholipid transport system substrate-binding protein